MVIKHRQLSKNTRSRRGLDRMVIRFTTICVISAYHHKSCEFESRSCPCVFVTEICQAHEYTVYLFQIFKHSENICIYIYIYIYIRLKIKPDSVRIRFQSCQIFVLPSTGFEPPPLINKGNNKITELRTILQRESPNS